MAPQKTDLKRIARKDFRRKMIAACVGVALAEIGSGVAFADSAVGVDTALGNALNPPGRSAIPRPVVEESIDTIRHSPSGQLYGIPYDRSDEGANKTESGWEYSGGIEAGVLTGDANQKSVLFRQYKDLKNGAYLDYFEVEAEKPDSANFIQAFGGGSGFNDQFYGFQFGRYNDWKMKLFYTETIHVFSTTWKSLFNGEGSGNLTTGLSMPTAVTTALTVGTAGGGSTLYGTYVGPTITAGNNCSTAAPCWSYGGKIYQNGVALAAINGVTGTANATTGIIPASVNPTTGVVNGATAQSNIAKAINDKLAAAPNSELSLVRQKGGGRFDIKLDNNWNAYAGYSQELRKGTRPFAMNEANMATEIAEPIDYTTHDLLAGLSYADSLTQANLRASASMFRNNISTLNVQYPFLSAATANGAVQTATYDLYPDNNALNVKGEFARSFPDFYKGRFNAAASWGTNRQNDDLLAPISAAQNAELAAAGISTLAGNNIGYGAGTGQVANWNTTAALSQQTARQRIDNRLIDLGLSFRPIDDLSVKGTFRNYQTVNMGGYTAYNPLTGQFGRGFADGANLTALDAIVGLRPGAIAGAAGSCYIPPGYPNTPNTTLPITSQCKFPAAALATGVFAANGANVPVYGQARSTKQTNIGLAADYDLTRSSSVNASLEREEFERNFRERAKTWEDKLKLGFVHRGLESATLRASYEVDQKRGGEYRYRTFEDMGTGLPGLSVQEQIAAATAVASAYQAIINNPASTPAQKTAATTALATAVPNANLFNRYSYYFRKYDQADRDQQILNLRLNYMAREDLDIGIFLQAKDVKYPDSFYGLEKDKLNTFSLDINYQPSSSETFYAFYSLQQGKKAMKLNSGIAGVASCTLANLALYGYSACSDTVTGLDGARPVTSAWSSYTDDQNDVLGIGFQKDMGKMRFGADYTYSRSRTRNTYTFGSGAFNNASAQANQTAATAAANAQAAAALMAGSALPDMTFVQQILTLNLLIPVDKNLSFRVFDRYEIGKVKDWHYDGVITGAAAAYDGTTLLIDSGPQNYHNNIIGVFAQYKL